MRSYVFPFCKRRGVHSSRISVWRQRSHSSRGYDTHRAFEICREVNVKVHRRRGAVVHAPGAAADEPRADERDEDGGHAETERRAEEIQPRPEDHRCPLAASPRLAPAPPGLPRPRGRGQSLPLEQAAAAAANRESGEVGAGGAHWSAGPARGGRRVGGDHGL